MKRKIKRKIKGIGLLRGESLVDVDIYNTSFEDIGPYEVQIPIEISYEVKK